jgi:oligoribonuclease (3'-5' exoribonuclease)
LALEEMAGLTPTQEAMAATRFLATSHLLVVVRVFATTTAQPEALVAVLGIEQPSHEQVGLVHRVKGLRVAIA